MLAAHRRTADAAGIEWKAALYREVREQVSDGSLAIQQMCALAGLSRKGYYRFDPNGEPQERDMDVRDAIQRIALEWPCYGRLRIAAELKRRGWRVNHKRVQRIMREDNLLCLRKRKFTVTTDSRHGYRVYQNLAARMSLDGINQLWTADITYIRLATEFVYLAVVLDSFSRKVIGWALGRTLEATLPMEALKMALAKRSAPTGLVHHSDRGVQYACGDYTGLLADHGIQISMSRKGNPYDNARAESFMKTLKYEEVFRQEYRDLADAGRSLKRFIEKVYNEKRLHSALGYKPPAEFERDILLAPPVSAVGAA
jgi:putative transposase